MTPDKLPEEIQQEVIDNSLTYLASLYSDGYVKERYQDGTLPTPHEWKAIRKSYQAGATAWAQWKVKHDELIKEHADLILALAAMLNGYQNLSMYQKDWFTVPKDLIDYYTKMVLEYDKAIKILNDGK